MRHQAVRPLSALLTIFVVVLVFGIAVGVLQATMDAPPGPHVEAQPRD